MLLDKGAVVNEKDNCGDAPVHCATLQGHCSIIRLLISRGANCCALGRLDNHFNKC